MKRIVYKGIKTEEADVLRLLDEIKRKMSGVEILQDELIGLYLTRDVSMLLVINALYELKIGFLPLDICAPKERNEKIIKEAGIKKILVNTDCNLSNVEILNINQMDEVAEETISNSAVAYCISTSGTTGKPKIVQIGRKAFEAWMEDFAMCFDETCGNTILCVSDYTFDMFMIESLFAIKMGWDIVLADESEQKNPIKLTQLIRKNQVDIVQATPSRIQLIRSMDKTLKCMEQVKLISLGGEKIGEELLSVLTKTPCRILNIYGPTETTVCCIVADLTKSTEEVLGTPLKHSSIVLVNSDLEEVKEGEEGEIIVAGECIADKYLNNEVDTAKRFIEWNNQRMYRTGDLAIKNANGQYVYKGRMDNQVKLRGYRLELEEIEEIIKTIATVENATVAVDYDKKELIGFYVSEHQIETNIIIKELKKHLPEYMIPYKYQKVEALPINSHGKLDRNILLNAKKVVKPSATINTEEDMTTVIIQLIKNKLEDYEKEINLETKVEDLGFDSIAYVEFLVELEEIYGIEFEDDKMSYKEFENVGAIIKYIQERIADK